MDIKWRDEYGAYAVIINNTEYRVSKEELREFRDNASEALANGCQHELTFFDTREWGYIHCQKCGMEVETKKEPRY